MEGVVKILVQVIQKATQAQPRHLLRVPLLPQQRHRQRLHPRHFLRWIEGCSVLQQPGDGGMKTTDRIDILDRAIGAIGDDHSTVDQLTPQISTTFATNSNLSPMLAVWIPNLSYIVLSVILLNKAPK